MWRKWKENFVGSEPRYKFWAPRWLLICFIFSFRAYNASLEGRLRLDGKDRYSHKGRRRQYWGGRIGLEYFIKRSMYIPKNKFDKAIFIYGKKGEAGNSVNEANINALLFWQAVEMSHAYCSCYISGKWMKEWLPFLASSTTVSFPNNFTP